MTSKLRSLILSTNSNLTFSLKVPKSKRQIKETNFLKINRKEILLQHQNKDNTVQM
jgi:hypothetical protein